jgi:capsular polysaccharide biosynthesis protein/Mrp family chromosome partitioning ATPase
MLRCFFQMPTSEESYRTLSDYLAVIRRRMLLIVLVTLVTIGAAAGLTFRQPTLYRSGMKLVVGVQGGLLPIDVGNVADQFTQTMSDLLQSEVVASSVIRDLDLHMSAQDLLSRLHITTKPDTAVLVVTYDDTVRSRSQSVLADIGAVFTTLVDQRLSTQDKGNLAVSVKVFNPSHLLPGRVQPKPVRNLAVAAMLGLILGLLAGFVREQFDDTVRGVEEAEQAFGQVATVTLSPGIVGYHPFDRQGKRADPILTELALQRLRATVLWSPESTEAARTLLVTSANPAEGKTTIAANLAVLMVIEGRNVIVVDADLRHPTLYRFLGMPLPLGDLSLGAVMDGQMSPTEALVEIPVPARAYTSMDGDQRLDSWQQTRREAPASGRLRAILAAPGRVRTAEFGLARSVEVIEALRRDADVVIFDCPPILVVPDAYPFAASVDMVVAVVRNGQASRKATAAFSRTLERLRTRRTELVVTEAESSVAQAYYYGYHPAAPSRRREANRPVALSGERGSSGSRRHSTSGEAGTTVARIQEQKDRDLPR